jgi:hypothetical protein
MSVALRFVLAALASFCVASSALGEVSVSTSGQSTASGGQVLFSDMSTSFFGPPYSLTVAAGGPVCPPPPEVCFFQWNGSGEASADLSTGTLGVYVDGFHGDGDIYTFLARASLRDTLTFQLPPGMDSAQVTISMSIEADLPPENLLGRVGGGALLGLGQDASFLYFQGLVASSTPTHFSQVLPVTTTVESGLPVDMTADLNAALTLVQTDHGTYVFDALQTATISLSVPAGVTYESTSGVFLAPEPSVDLLGCFAVGVLAAVRPATKRRRRHSARRSRGYGAGPRKSSRRRRSSGSRSGWPACRRRWRDERSALGCCFVPCSGRSS